MKKILKNILPYIVLFTILLIFHMLMKPCGDDFWFSKELSNSSLIEYIVFRYNNWTSRIIIEPFLLLFASSNMYIWRIIDVLIFILSMVCIIKLVDKNNNYKLTILGIILFLIYPIYELSSAGWIATTTNYSWPFAFGIFSFIPLINNENKKKTNIIIYILCLLSLIYATNQEQVCALIFGFNTLYLANCIIKKKEISKYNITAIIISILSLIFIFTCPGNSVRFAAEINNWLPEYSNYGIIRKIYLGIVPIINLLLGDNIFAIFYVLLNINVITKTKNLSLKVLLYFNIILILSLTVLRPLLLQLYPRFNEFIYVFSLTKVPSINRVSLIVVMLSSYLIISSIYLLYKLFTIKKLLPVFIFIGGFLSSFITCLSPTVIISITRTSYFFYMLLIILILFIIEKMYEEKKINNKNELLLFVILFALAIYNCINIFLVI